MEKPKPSISDRWRLWVPGTAGFGMMEYGLATGDDLLNNGLALTLVTAAAFAINRGLTREPGDIRSLSAIFDHLGAGQRVRTAGKALLPLAVGAAAYKAGLSIEDTQTVAKIGAAEGAASVIFAAKSYPRRRT